SPSRDVGIDQRARLLSHSSLWGPVGSGTRLDPRPLTGQCRRSGWAREMKILSHLSPGGEELPEPADERRLALGFEAWREALTLAPGGPAVGAAHDWSAAPCGKRLLASIFGNSPFLGGVAVREWAFLTRLVEEGADPLFAETAAAIE